MTHYSRMTHAEPPARSSIQPYYLIILIALLQLFISLLTDGFSLSFDEAMWHYIGRNWFRHGLVPYDGGVDNKSPLIFAIYGLSDFLFGVNFWFPRLLGTAIEAVGIYYIYKIAVHLSDRKAGLVALSLYGLSLLWRSTDGKFVSLSETYAVTCIIIAFYQCLDARTTLAIFFGGFLAAAGLGFRLSAIFGMVAIAVMAFRKGVNSGVVFCMGVLAGIVLLAACFALAGISVTDFLHYGFTDNFGPGSPTDQPFSWRVERFVNQFFYSELVLFYPALAGYFMLRQKNPPVIWWLLLEFAGICAIGLFARAHFKHLLPPLSLTAALAVTYCIREYNWALKTVLIIIWIVFFPKTLEPFISLKKLFVPLRDNSSLYCQDLRRPNEDAEKKLGQWIKRNTKETDQVLVAGYGVLVQVYSERTSPSIYFNVTQTKSATARFIDDIAKSRPAIAAVPVFSTYKQLVRADIRTVIEEMISARYYFDRCLYGYTIYRLRDEH